MTIRHTEALFLFYKICSLFSGWNDKYLTLGTLKTGYYTNLATGPGHPKSGMGSYSLSMFSKYI